MPVYKFKCDRCGSVFEKYFHMSDQKAAVLCPECHSDDVHRVYSVPFKEFKGKGFYVNDNRQKNHNSADKHMP
jgi:putative FmdB family regulatory protein